ncbi:MAG: hypothetical protein TE42_10545, partial [Candidatus Synechococcus spongiarum SP3]
QHLIGDGAAEAGQPVDGHGVGLGSVMTPIDSPSRMVRPADGLESRSRICSAIPRFQHYLMISVLIRQRHPAVKTQKFKISLWRGRQAVSNSCAKLRNIGRRSLPRRLSNLMLHCCSNLVAYCSETRKPIH